jgi:hypothetical protein
MITDRDICMAAYICGRDLRSIEVRATMSAPPYTCHVDDDLHAVEQTMQHDADVAATMAAVSAPRLVTIAST